MAGMALDLTGYFERIDYRGAADPTLDVLQDLVTAHTRSIPFENLDPLLGRPIDDLSAEALIDKLVHPASHFVTRLMVSLITADGRFNLAGRDLTFHGSDTTEKTRLDDAAAVVDALADRFGINVADAAGRGALEARIAEISTQPSQG